ncbi:Mobile element protein [hydrothermal vent metagenome]|uniref:Mobile element protein n=1 Tax=hydrothermal vent metagenome TaxID=652676 RepID=A0A3B0Y5M1_9ZZZZ
MSSEKISPDQVRLFDEAESDLLIDDENIDDFPSEESIIVSAHTSKKSGRKPLPATLLRLDVIHELSEAERVCPHDGNTLNEMSEVISEQLDIIPATIQVIRHIQKQYACSCGKCIKLAPKLAQPIPKSLASPGLLAHVTVSKIQDALRLYRQEKIMQRIGVDIPRATLANWMVNSGELAQPVINLLRDQLLSYDIIQMDETTVQVLNEPGKTAQSKSYLWVQRSGPPDCPVILFDYDPGRGSSVPTRLLEGFKGYLQTDGYAGYNAVVENNKLFHLACMAHVRRKFTDALKAQGKKKKNTSLAQQGLTLIQKLYGVEKQTKDFSPEKRYDYRIEKSKPLFEKLRVWLDKNLAQTPPTSATGKAVHYLNNEWGKLIVYLDDGRLNIDNNLAENAIRPFVVV